MPANRNILLREESRAAFLQDHEPLLEILRGLVDEGTQLLARLNQVVTGAGERELHLHLLLQLRHALGLADAVDELFREGVVTPAILQARGLAETHAAGLFLVGRRSVFAVAPLPQGAEKDPRPADAQGQPLVGDALERAKDSRADWLRCGELRRASQNADDLNAANITQFFADAGGGQPPAVALDPANQQGLANERAHFDALLQTPRFAQIDAEFTRLRGGRAIDPPWYSLYDGPRSVYQLFLAVGLRHEYRFFYGPASEYMHAADLRQGLAEGAGGGVVLRRLRGQEKLWEVAVRTLIHLLGVYHTCIDEIRPVDAAEWAGWVARVREIA